MEEIEIFLYICPHSENFDLIFGLKNKKKIIKFTPRLGQMLA
jgi:hypothetical protein